MNKYNAKRTEIKIGKEVYKFDSKKEANRFLVLVQLQKMGKIEGLTLQPQFLLQPSFMIDEEKHLPIKYIADFAYVDVKTGEKIVEDVKGHETEVFKIKHKLFKYQMLMGKYPKLTLKLVR